MTTIFDENFSGRVLAFDNHATDVYADIGAARKQASQPISQFDGMIAAMARSHGATLATRNTRDFTDCGIDLADPWTATSA